MVLEFLRDTFWGSQAAAAGTGLLLAMAACIWAMNLGNASALRLFRQRSAQEATGTAAQISATNLHIISALLLGTNSLLAGILCALLFGGMSWHLIVFVNALVRCWSTAALAAMAQVSPVTARRWQAGKRPIPEQVGAAIEAMARAVEQLSAKLSDSPTTWWATSIDSWRCSRSGSRLSARP
jgi:hypothetical protein